MAIFSRMLHWAENHISNTLENVVMKNFHAFLTWKSVKMRGNFTLPHFQCIENLVSRPVLGLQPGDRRRASQLVL